MDPRLREDDEQKRAFLPTSRHPSEGWGPVLDSFLLPSPQRRLGSSSWLISLAVAPAQAGVQFCAWSSGASARTGSQPSLGWRAGAFAGM